MIDKVLEIDKVLDVLTAVVLGALLAWGLLEYLTM